MHVNRRRLVFGALFEVNGHPTRTVDRSNSHFFHFYERNIKTDPATSLAFGRRGGETRTDVLHFDLPDLCVSCLFRLDSELLQKIEPGIITFFGAVAGSTEEREHRR